MKHKKLIMEVKITSIPNLQKFLSALCLLVSWTLFSISFSYAQSNSPQCTPKPSPTPPEDCSCETVEVLCVERWRIRRYCGSGKLACMFQAPNCSIYMSQSDCAAIGLRSSYKQVPVEKLERDFLSDDREPADSLAQMDARCLFAHEIRHTKQTECSDSENPDCFENDALEESVSCKQDEINIYLEANQNDDFVKNMCISVLDSVAYRETASCLCNESGGCPDVEYDQETKSKCFLQCMWNSSPDDLPDACSEHIGWGSSADEYPESGPSWVEGFCRKVL